MITLAQLTTTYPPKPRPRTDEQLRLLQQKTREDGPVPITVRLVDTDKTTREWNFVHETALKIRWPKIAQIDWREWRQMAGPVVDLWMLDGRTYVADAGNGVVLGFAIVCGDNTVAALYVKAAFRGQRVGLALLQAPNLSLPLRAYHPTECWRRWTSYHRIPWEHVNHGHDRDSALGLVHPA